MKVKLIAILLLSLSFIFGCEIGQDGTVVKYVVSGDSPLISITGKDVRGNDIEEVTWRDLDEGSNYSVTADETSKPYLFIYANKDEDSTTTTITVTVYLDDVQIMTASSTAANEQLKAYYFDGTGSITNRAGIPLAGYTAK
ncbi:MAG: hypothetical protein GY754_12955 [bacterium]|nr:hypothetical protein [bacterium]